MTFNYALNNKDYNLRNALLWGNCFAHYRKASQGCLGHRVIHVIIASVEALPLLGQIASLMEYLIVHVFSKKEASSSPLQRRITLSHSTDLKPHLPKSSIENEIYNSIEGNLRGAEKRILAKIYLDFLNHFAEFLYECLLNNRSADPFYSYKVEEENSEYFSKMKELPPELTYYWNYWSQRPEEFIKLFHDRIGRSNTLFKSGKEIRPPFKEKPFVRQDDVENEKIQSALQDDGIAFFQWVTYRNQPNLPPCFLLPPPNPKFNL